MDKRMLTGIVLAGGKSRRFGTNKALMEIHGKKLAEYAINLLEKFCSSILISTNEPLPFNYEQIADIQPDLGPVMGIYSCLNQSKTPYNLILSCDMPLVNEGLISFLIEQIDKEKIIVPVHDNDLYEPLCAIYPTSCFKAMGDFIHNQSFALHEFIDSQENIKVKISDGLDFWINNLFTNINTVNDIESIL
jgi:molybdopterin-guanine dinucleotide biosynthesis protein A